MKTIKLLIAGALICFSMAGQAQKRTKTVSKTKTVSASTTISQDNDVHIDGASITKTIAMNGGNLFIDGADCNITVTGSVNTITVNGAGVTVHADRVNAIKIEGASTHVYYKTSGNKNGRASVSVFGAGSGVTKK